MQEVTQSSQLGYIDLNLNLVVYYSLVVSFLVLVLEALSQSDIVVFIRFDQCLSNKMFCSLFLVNICARGAIFDFELTWFMEN